MSRTATARHTLTQMPVAHLRDLAREAGLRGHARLRKAELVAALIPAHLAEMDLVAANRARKASAEAEAEAPARTGHAECECRDCPDVTIGGGVCYHCEEAGCSDDADQECYRPDAYEG